MSEDTNIAERIEKFYESLSDIVADQVLRCEWCGREQPAEGRFFRDGWPTCHGSTMLMVAAKEEE